MSISSGVTPAVPSRSGNLPLVPSQSAAALPAGPIPVSTSTTEESPVSRYVWKCSHHPPSGATLPGARSAVQAWCSSFHPGNASPTGSGNSATASHSTVTSTRRFNPTPRTDTPPRRPRPGVSVRDVRGRCALPVSTRRPGDPDPACPYGRCVADVHFPCRHAALVTRTRRVRTGGVWRMRTSRVDTPPRRSGTGVSVWEVRAGSGTAPAAGAVGRKWWRCTASVVCDLAESPAEVVMRGRWCPFAPQMAPSRSVCASGNGPDEWRRGNLRAPRAGGPCPASSRTDTPPPRPGSGVSVREAGQVWWMWAGGRRGWAGRLRMGG